MRSVMGTLAAVGDSAAPRAGSSTAGARPLSRILDATPSTAIAPDRVK